jgi:hypothetical protein
MIALDGVTRNLLLAWSDCALGRSLNAVRSYLRVLSEGSLHQVYEFLYRPTRNTWRRLDVLKLDEP